MDPVGIRLGEIIRERQIPYDFTYVESKKQNKGYKREIDS